VSDPFLEFAADATSFTGAGLDVRDVVLDPVFAKRRDALLRTVPLHELVDRAARVDSRFAQFDVRALALAAFDAVIARQGFSDPATPASVLSLLTGIAGVQQPDTDEALRLAVAEHVLDGLTNRRERERQFQLTSFIYSTDDHGKIIATGVPRPFWLLREQEDSATGGVWLEASGDAINALIGGLNISIEDQQCALDLVLARQVERGDLDAAHITAEQKRLTTTGLITQVNEMLAMTEQHVQSAGWHDGTAAALIDKALAHIEECLAREGSLIEHVRAGRDNADPHDPQAAHRARVTERLTVLLTDSRTLHTHLLARVMGARARFLDAQDSTMFRPPITTFELNISEGLFVPMLGLHVRDGQTVAAAYLQSAIGPQPPTIVNWGDMVDALLRPAPEPTTAEEPDETDLQFRPDPEPMISADLVARTRALLRSVPLPARLSALLAACPDDPGDVAAPHDLVCAAALRAFDNHHETSEPDWIVPDDDHVGMQAQRATLSLEALWLFGPDAACAADALQLNGPGWSGDDLIVCADRDQRDAILLGDLPAPSPVPLPARHRRRTA
jgi:hypothetical protein